MSRDPSQLLYAKTHEWADVADEGAGKVATVGISAFAIEQLTDLVYMDLPKLGTRVKAGEEFGEVESVKAVSPLYSPVDGEIIEIHAELPDELEAMKDDPYQFGWIMKVKLDDDTALAQLLDHATYEQRCSEGG